MEDQETQTNEEATLFIAGQQVDLVNGTLRIEGHGTSNEIIRDGQRHFPGLEPHVYRNMAQTIISMKSINLLVSDGQVVCSVTGQLARSYRLPPTPQTLTKMQSQIKTLLRARAHVAQLEDRVGLPPGGLIDLEAEGLTAKDVDLESKKLEAYLGRALNPLGKAT